MKSEHFGNQFPNGEEAIENEDDVWSFDIIEVGADDADTDDSNGNWIELGKFELPNKQLDGGIDDSEENITQESDNLQNSYLMREAREEMTPFEFQSLHSMTASSIDTIGSTVEEVFDPIQGVNQTKTNLVTVTGVVFFAIVLVALTGILLFVRKRKFFETQLLTSG